MNKQLFMEWIMNGNSAYAAYVDGENIECNKYALEVIEYDELGNLYYLVLKDVDAPDLTFNTDDFGEDEGYSINKEMAKKLAWEKHCERVERNEKAFKDYCNSLCGCN